MIPPRVVLDLGGLDGLWAGAGLFRYVVDLTLSMAEETPEVQLVVLGAKKTPIPELAPLFENGNGSWIYRQFARTSGLAAAYRDQVRLAAVLARLRADLCHCLHTIAPLVSSCPLVATIQDMMFELFPEFSQAVRSRPYRMFKWCIQRRVQRVICPSQTTADDLMRLWNVSCGRIDVVPHGLRDFGNGSSFIRHVQCTVLADVAGPIISSPFNLEPRKNMLTLLEAFAIVRTRIPSAKLVLFGRGGWTPERNAKYRMDVQRLGLEGHLLETGIIADSELWTLYKRSDVFSTPTLYEGFGYPALEAMSAGVCPVVRGSSSMAEVVGDAGVKVEPLTAKALGEALIELLLNETKRKQLGAAAIARSRQFTAKRMAQGTLRTYDDVLTQTRKRSRRR